LGKRSDKNIETLDVGCGSQKYAKGTVNVDICRGGRNRQVGDQTAGEILNPRRISNFIVADACHLPFRDKVFDSVFSSHVIEHTPDPFLMFKEVNRVSKGTVTIRCPHRRGSGAKKPFHLQYLDEKWLKHAADTLGLESKQSITVYDYPLSNRIPMLSQWVYNGTKIGVLVASSLPWRIVRHFERKYLIPRLKVPFEVESCSISDGKRKL
jgi:SAM-dependent methyltransferase